MMRTDEVVAVINEAVKRCYLHKQKRKMFVKLTIITINKKRR